MLEKFIESIFNFIKYLFIAGIGPVIVTLLFVVFTVFYWGGGTTLIGVVLFMTLICGIGSLVIVSILKNSSTYKKILVTSIFTFIVGSLIQLFQYSGSTPTQLKNAVLVDSVQNLVNVKEARLFTIGFENEIYLQLESQPKYTKKLLLSQKFDSSDFGRKQLKLDAPSWFPKQFPKEDYDIFVYRNDTTQIMHYAFISKDEKTIYYFYLDY